LTAKVRSTAPAGASRKLLPATIPALLITISTYFEEVVVVVVVVVVEVEFEFEVEFEVESL